MSSACVKMKIFFCNFSNEIKIIIEDISNYKDEI